MEIALYRKYRPRSFEDVLGQEQVSGVLSEAVKLGNLFHAYLFSGARGTGKTSVARILAGEIGTTKNDLHEIDAASNRGIDDIRELRQAVLSLPYESKYKVYIIDEAHMLTKEAFNALLKTLEEPPSHVIFILATTELHKLPETIISRCETYDFKKAGREILKELVLRVSKEEGFKIDNAGAELLSVLGDGSFRDTLGVLQKIISGSKDKKISLPEIEKITGAPPRDVINTVLEALADGRSEEALRFIGNTAEKNTDMKIFIKLILSKLRLALLNRYAKDMRKDILRELGAEDYEFIKRLSEKPKVNSKTLQRLLKAYIETPDAYISQLPLELAVIDIAEEEKEKEN